MEQFSHYLMWVKSKNVNSMLMNPVHQSWEEAAFAEDARRGPLGGFVWPPRSYSCSFCRREFRSAQALGGHMNVHRRERAKLKQPLISRTQNPNQQTPQNPGFESSPISQSNVHRKTISGDNSDDVLLVQSPGDDDEDGGGGVGTNLFLGFDFDSPRSCLDSSNGEQVMSCKRRKTAVAPPLIVSSIGEVDLELRLAS